MQLSGAHAHAHLNAVILKANQEAGGQLGTRGARIEQRRRSMSEPALRQEVIRLNCTVNVLDRPHSLCGIQSVVQECSKRG